jgi:hypothetical protein
VSENGGETMLRAYWFGFDKESRTPFFGIDPEDAFLWIIMYINECRQQVLIDRHINELSEARNDRRGWRYCINETVLTYDPFRERMTAVFMPIDDDRENEMDSAIFLKILREWREHVIAHS